jgi:hypothetical protein
MPPGRNCQTRPRHPGWWLRPTGLLLLALASMILVAVPARADIIPPLSNNSWAASGAAEIYDPPKAASYVTSDQQGAAGSVLYRAAISPSHLSVSFEEGMACGEEACNGADGIAFDILNASGLSASPPAGQGGGALGFYPNTGLAITLTQNSTPWGCYPADHFIGIADSEPPSGCPLHYLKTAAGIPTLHNAENHIVIEADWPTETITVSINGVQYLSYELPSGDPLPSTAYIGFSAGTGNGAEYHRVEDVSGTYSPIQESSAPAPQSPPPTTWPPPAPAPSSCPNVAIYGVRGSGEDYRRNELGMGPTVHKVASELDRQVPSSYRVLQAGVPYRAGDARLAIFGGMGKGPYNDSVLEGAELLVNGRANADGLSEFGGIASLVGRCSQVKLVLIGLSQGAQVITTALAQAHHQGPVTKRIRAVLLYGNPIRLRSLPYDVGTNAYDGILSDRGLQPGGIAERLPQFLWPITQSYCLNHDPICAFSREDFAHHRDVHDTYDSSSFVRQGVTFAVRRLR